MDNRTLSEIITAWALAQTEPFTSRDVLEANDEIENITQVSAAMNVLFNNGTIARKKIDGLKFVFMPSDKAPEDFERNSATMGSCKRNDAAKESAAGIEREWPAGSKTQTTKGPKENTKNPIKTSANKNENSQKLPTRVIEISAHKCDQFNVVKKGEVVVITGSATFKVSATPGSRLSISITDISI